MKKMFKVLIPTLSSLVLAGSVIPLVGCNKKSGTDENKVTEQEWKDAIDYLGWNGKEMPYWSFGPEDYAYFNSPNVGGEDSLFVFTNWVATPKGVSADYYHRSKDGREDTHKTYETVSGDFIYGYQKGNTPEGTGYGICDFSDLHSPTALIYVALTSVYDYYGDFKFNETDKHYHYSGELLQFMSVDTQIMFDKNKRVSHVDATLTFNDEGVISTAKTNFVLNYDKKEISWPDGFFDRASRHIHDIKPSGTDIDLTSCETEKEGVILNVVVDDEYNTIKAYKDSTLKKMFYSSVYIYKDGIKLEQSFGTDGDFVVKDDGYIKFNKPLVKGNVISMSFEPFLTDNTYTFKLEK